HEEGRSVTDRALNRDRSTVLLHDPIGDGEADARSAKLAASRLVYTVKTFEDLALIVFGDSNSRVAHRNDRVAMPRCQTQFDDPRRWRVLDGVVEKDGQQSLHGPAVSLDRKGTICDRLSELQIARLHQRTPFVSRICNRCAQIKGR